MDYRLRRHDGEYRWILDRSKPVEIGGEFAGFIGFALDATERHDMDATRHDMEEQVRLLTLATRDMVWSWDERSGRVIHNTAFSEVLGDVPGPVDATVEWWKLRVHSEDQERAIPEAGSVDVRMTGRGGRLVEPAQGQRRLRHQNLREA